MTGERASNKRRASRRLHNSRLALAADNHAPFLTVLHRHCSSLRYTEPYNANSLTSVVGSHQSVIRAPVLG